eukprot:TRINITY_DN14544_c0_g1_i1.p1 TRINITY_DN14544_c0_g1~~TRINITY_DN14544_c0_g1_i1.p1  ORF type:complete len:329 (+),score=122.66 TRINITY_DN14544_c0_g1_i1:75-1061(+)
MADTVRMRAEAYAFRQLVAHLQEHTEVQNIDVMNLAGFCRNCLSKWYYVGARKEGMALTMDEASEDVYGMPYKDWKKQHQSPATEEQMRLFKERSSVHAKHPPMPKEPAPAGTTEVTVPKPPAAAASKASVCCQDVEALHAAAAPAADASSYGTPTAKVAVLTVSDRASRGVYQDLSGPEIERSLAAYAEGTGAFALDVVARRVVADEQETIEGTLRDWADTAGMCNVILTTGGTGLSVRDVTPEATASVVDRMVPGMTEVMRREGSKFVSLAVLSRAVAGLRKKTLIVNLPGNPKAVKESLYILMPLFNRVLGELGKESSLPAGLQE